jgi:hypothetical protein
MTGDTASPTELGNTERKVIGSADLLGVERQRGQEHIGKAGEGRDAEHRSPRKTRAAWSRLDCLKPNVDGHSKARSYCV